MVQSQTCGFSTRICIPADMFCSDTLCVHTDPNSFRALLKSAVSGTDHRIDTTKEACGFGAVSKDLSTSCLMRVEPAWKIEDKACK